MINILASKEMLARLTLRILNVVLPKDKIEHITYVGEVIVEGCHMQDLLGCCPEYSRSFRISGRLWRAELECFSPLQKAQSKHSFHLSSL